MMMMKYFFHSLIIIFALRVYSLFFLFSFLSASDVSFSNFCDGRMGYSVNTICTYHIFLFQTCNPETPFRSGQFTRKETHTIRSLNFARIPHLTSYISKNQVTKSNNRLSTA